MKEKMDCVIVDDEPLALDLLEKYISRIPFLNLTGRYDDSLEAVSAIRNNKPDLLLFDIQMPDLNGLELAHLVGKDCSVIFVTAFQQYALEGFKANAIDYLLKPVSYAEFLTAVEKAYDLFVLRQKAETVMTAEQGVPLKPTSRETLFIKTEYKLQQINLQDILYIEGLKDYIKIYLQGEQKAVLSRTTMKSIEALLPESDFIRVHRSFIVRKDKIHIIERNRIVFGNTYIPVSDSYKEGFQAFLNDNLLQNDFPLDS